ncbi:hypothetical protein RND81_07G091200 [Saponaria officinalis]|uniref:rRNA methyltransferase 1, mitochondrial n=1 Tax=Saponaria officinalis TaxID=3572 RepID=A0AAW1JLF9_SAPOF
MYCNLSKTHALPTVFLVSSKQYVGLNLGKNSKIQSFSNGVYLKSSLNPKNFGFGGPKRHQLSKPRKMSVNFSGLCAEFDVKKSQLLGFRSFSSLKNDGHRKNLPWLVDSGYDDKVMKVKASNSSGGSNGKSSWEISAEKFVQRSGGSAVEDVGGRGRAVDVVEDSRKPRLRRDSSSSSSSSNSRSSWGNSAEKFVRKSGGSAVKEGRRSRVVNVAEDSRKPRLRRDSNSSSNSNSKSSWGNSAEKFVRRSGGSAVEEDWRNPRVRQDESDEEDGEDEGVVNDPRWDTIKTRAGRVIDGRVGSDRPELRGRWNREESWGRKTYREASESSVPKIVGEALYGVGPVLAALSAGRREFYTLYVQEGLELSKNNKKRKDKKGFEKVLKIADKIGLSLREVSKHDLNMVSDNRPHQGLVLDTSPLEMVNIKELETISSEHDKGVLWVALDEVTDPQNLGAIIRSSYFFGAAGVVLCAKNSAPLSGVVSKASAGSLELMEMRSCKNMMQFLTSSAENGWRVVGGSVSSRAVPLREVAPGEPTILVLGSEGTGLRPLVERSCTQLVKIPGNIPVDVTSGGFEDDGVGDEPVEEEVQSSREEFQSFMAVESLNVSVAAGVLLHHFIGYNYTSLNHAGNVNNIALD